VGGFGGDGVVVRRYGSRNNDVVLHDHTKTIDEGLDGQTRGTRQTTKAKRGAGGVDVEEKIDVMKSWLHDLGKSMISFSGLELCLNSNHHLFTLGV
jgi:hypothetical protein